MQIEIKNKAKIKERKNFPQKLDFVSIWGCGLCFNSNICHI